VRRDKRCKEEKKPSLYTFALPLCSFALSFQGFSMKKWLTLVLLLIQLTACGEDVPFLGSEPTPTFDFNMLTVDTGVDLISAEGQIMPLRQARLAFQASGRVAEILVAGGDQVEAGQPLIRLDAAEQSLQVEEAEAIVAQIEAGLDAAESRLAAAKAALRSAALGVNAAEAQLALLLAVPRPEEIAVAEARVAAAQAGISQASGSRDGQLRIDPASISEAQAHVAAAMAEQDGLQQQYDDLLENEILGAPEEEARLQLQAAAANLAAAQAALDLLYQGPTAAQQRTANAAVGVAVAQRDMAIAQLERLQAGPRPAQIREGEVRVEQARARQTQAEVALIEAEAAVMQAETAVTQAQATLTAAQNVLNRMTLTAPFAGTVADVSVRPGEIVSPGVPVLVLADMSNWLVKTTDLTELSVVSLGVGLPVEISVDAIPDADLSGTVTDIATVSQRVRGDVVYEVIIRLDEDQAQALPLRWGMTVFVNVYVGDR
jgi:HlyD family secretion protein